MKQIFSALVLIQALSCSTKKTPIVDQIFVDSLITHWSNPAAASLNEKEIAFWRGRIDERRPGMVNEQKYASTLRTRFQMFGNIADLRNADSILLAVDERFRKTESSISLNLVSYSISLHQFKRAGEFLEHARLTGARKYSLLLASFDVYFELGQYDSAARVLKMINDDKDYNYLFRLSKLEHLYGNTDSAIICMLKAAENAGEDITQMQVALSNAADLCLHSGDVEKANSLYMKCIRLNGTDFHSMMGLGWISWVNDHADSAAEKIFSFVRSKTQSPEALYKLTQLEASKANPESAKKYADEFIVSVENPAYGNMYNKYLIDLFVYYQ
jgi:tetratricopeptide (TPR) repeat protein